MKTPPFAASTLVVGASPSFAQTLHTDKPAADRADKMALYGWLIGRWEMDSIVHQDDGTHAPGPRGEIHFGWVLEGRAIQDVWILPGVFHGTTLRVYDPGLDAWHILWSDPLKQYYARQIGRARGRDIVQEGKDEAGTPLRWSFTEITFDGSTFDGSTFDGSTLDGSRPDAFHWLGERSPDGGASWQLQIEFFARRVVAG